MSDHTHSQESLEPPPRKSMEDPGAHELDSSDSEDQFVDAHTGEDSSVPSGAPSPGRRKPKHGHEDPYGMTQLDLDTGVVSESMLSPASASRPTTPGGQPIPTTVVEKVDPLSPSYGEVPGTDEYERRKADATPDIVAKVDGDEPDDLSLSRPRAASTPGDLPIPTTRLEPAQDDARTGTMSPLPSPSGPRRKETADDDFGDDFDEFEEGEDDADFGEFDDGFHEADVAVPAASPTVMPAFPTLDFDTLDGEDEILAATEPHLNALFPPADLPASRLPPATNPVFLTERSASLWSQLVAPPPLQPPNWIRSRIRRLFLVSLGVPVDLDEILPASKQKKLILPSVSANRMSTSSDRGALSDGNLGRLKQAGSANASNTSLDSQGRAKRRRDRGPPPPPTLDVVAGRQLCQTTDAALAGMTLDELRAHVDQLRELETAAADVLAYWTARIDEKLGDREAFEAVIENLVKHARKVRK